MRQPTTNIVSGRQLRAARVLAGLTQAQLAQQAGFHERACRYWEARGDDPPTTTPSSLAKIEAALGRNGVAVFRDPTCVRPASTRAALNCRPETILVVGCLMDAYSTVTYWAACLYQIRGYLAVLNGPA